MERIINKDDLRHAYELIDLFNELAEKRPDSVFAKNIVIKTKRLIREFVKRTSDRRIVKSYGCDGYVELVKLPNHLKTKEDANKYFDEEERIVCPPSAYDCTGRAFTCWFKIFKRRDNFYAYHSIGYDV